MAKIKKFADDNQIIVKYENLKSIIQKENKEIIGKINFFFFLMTEKVSLTENLKKYFEKEMRKNKRYDKIE